MASSTPPALDGHPWARLLDLLDRGWRAVGVCLLWTLAALPLVTTGPATVAMFGAVRDDRLGRWRPLLRGFVDDFRSSWRAGVTVGGLVALPLLGRLAWRLSGGTRIATVDSGVWLITTIGVTLGLVLASFAFPLAAHLDAGVRRLLRTSVLFMLARPRVTVCHLLLTTAACWVVARIPLALPLIMLLLALALTQSVHRMLAREAHRS